MQFIIKCKIFGGFSLSIKIDEFLFIFPWHYKNLAYDYYFYMLYIVLKIKESYVK